MNTKTTDTKKIEQLFNVGAHFGFTKRRRHPTVVPYLYGTKDGNDIFDLEKTAALLENATALVEDFAKQGKTIMYVGTKNEVKQLVLDAATEANAPYVVNRWIGGQLTNFTEIKKRIQRLTDLEAEQAAGTLERKYTKKERVMIGREMAKLRFNFAGVQNLQRVPDLLVVVDPRHESIAIEEATLLGIPTVGIMSSDSDITSVTYPVLMNDGLQESVSYALSQLVAAHTAGAAAFVPAPTAPTRTTRPRTTTARS